MTTKFVSVLLNILGGPEHYHLISWSPAGDSFIVKDTSRFSREVLPKYFNHTNFTSFHRRLNQHGFRLKAKTKVETMGATKSGGDKLKEFVHPHFRRDDPKSSCLIQLQGANGTSDEGGGSKVVGKGPGLSAIMKDIYLMKGEQGDIDTLLESLQRDNKQLCHELNALKDKYRRKEVLLKKIVHFLVNMVLRKRKVSSSKRSTKSNGSFLNKQPTLLHPSNTLLTTPTSSSLLPATSSSLLGMLSTASLVPATSSSSSLVPVDPSSLLSMPSVAAPATAPSLLATPTSSSVVPATFPSSAKFFDPSPPLASPAPLAQLPSGLEIVSGSDATWSSSVAPVKYHENRACELQHQHMELDQLPELLAGLDPSLIPELMSSSLSISAGSGSGDTNSDPLMKYGCLDDPEGTLGEQLSGPSLAWEEAVHDPQLYLTPNV